MVSASCQTSANPLDTLIGKDKLRKTLEEIVENARIKAEFCRRNGIGARMQLSFVITGDAGTGKTTIAQAIAAALASIDVLKSPEAEVVNPVDYDNWIKNIDKNAQRLANSALIVEEAQKLVPEGEAEEVAKLDHILQLARRWREDGSKPVVIITGNRRLGKFFEENPNSASAINYFFETEGLSVDSLMEIARRQLREKYQRTLSKEADEKLRRIFLNDRRSPDDALGAGGHNATARAYQIDIAAIGASDSVLGPEYVKGKEFKPKTLNEVMAEFNKYVGVDEVKNAIRTIANNIQEDMKAGREPRMMHHYQFLGNPGTGKTTMARLFAEALNALGALPIGHLKEVTKDDLVSQFVAGTSEKVNDVFRQAMGGVLFIDEAYQLGNDSHGKDAVDTLIKLVEDNRGKVVVILAGYTKEMGEFMRSMNTGTESRFDEVINFRDYTPEELTEIFRRQVYNSPEGLRLDPETEANVGNVFKKMYMTRTRTFDNARAVVKLFRKSVERMKSRLAANPSSPYALTMADIEGEEGKTQTVEDILAELDDMLGMDSVKAQIRKIARNVELNRRRAQTGRAGAKVINVHIAITGNPGTGKTEIAKRLGKIFKAMGILPKGHVVERERKSLLDSMANSAGVNMDKAVDEAMGGVLFIDEAYNLIPMNNPNDKDKDGTAAVEALMTRMSNDAGKFVTVIAGYKTEIDEFIENSNPGLKRRFTHRIHIDDYPAEVLVEIYKAAAKRDNFTLTPQAEELLGKKVQEMVTMKDKNFGNAGSMMNLLKQTLENQSDRLGEKDEITDDELFTIEACDIPYESPKKVDIKECMRQLDELVGLDGVKKTIRELADTIMVEQERASMEGRQPRYPMTHYLFLGNPGTGKTTVARIMGDIFYSLGLLPSNKLVEVKPSDMIIGYIGQTAAQTRKVINRGLGGVLFIDEAYGLHDGGYGTKDATPELLTMLNDYKGRMVCIAAGYPREITQWLSTNAGLPRRFETHIVFEDYNAEDLTKIFLNIARKESMRLDEFAIEEMQTYFRTLVYNKGADFGNAAEAGKYFSKVKINQGARLRKMASYDREELYWLRREDMILEP